MKYRALLSAALLFTASIDSARAASPCSGPKSQVTHRQSQIKALRRRLDGANRILAVFARSETREYERYKNTLNGFGTQLGKLGSQFFNFLQVQFDPEIDIEDSGNVEVDATGQTLWVRSVTLPITPVDFFSYKGYIEYLAWNKKPITLATEVGSSVDHLSLRSTLNDLYGDPTLEILTGSERSKIIRQQAAAMRRLESIHQKLVSRYAALNAASLKHRNKEARDLKKGLRLKGTADSLSVKLFGTVSPSDLTDAYLDSITDNASLYGQLNILRTTLTTCQAKHP